MKVIEAIWFTNIAGCIGIVIGEDDATGDRKAYIGLGTGQDQEIDTERIVSWGNKLSLSKAQRIVSLLTVKEG